ncbi:DUF4328 domain-containing protein [Streptomyces ficellus]|uniref:DUF4328 domain-containing protein n=1 Tax=Streptomyces ficellus TaxID=1977088 RepID=A0ABT7Z8V5_9ACTN|nr:DUF4328 domain-containing protein [Streptomyces ficellus]MDN3295935.1 DUF4328 domain-containing protein [Streptomyces ficellus]
MHTAMTKDGLCEGCAHPSAAVRPVGPPGPPNPPRSVAVALPHSPTGLSRAVVALLGVVIAVDLYALVADVHLYVLAHGALNDPAADLDRGYLLISVAAGLQMVALAATAVLFIIWLHRVRVNAGVLAPDVLTNGPGWAIGGWFIPVVNLWIPRRIARETWQASKRDPHDGPGHKEPATVLNVWWALWLLTRLLAMVASNAYEDAWHPQDVKDACELLILADTADIAAAAFAILTVRRLTAMQFGRSKAGSPVPALSPKV